MCVFVLVLVVVVVVVAVVDGDGDGDGDGDDDDDGDDGDDGDEPQAPRGAACRAPEWPSRRRCSHWSGRLTSLGASCIAAPSYLPNQARRDHARRLNVSCGLKL